MKIIFFCGDQSRYGIAHLMPLLESKFQISKVVIATPNRWEIFRKNLQGEKYYDHKEFLSFNIKSIINLTLPTRIKNFLKTFRDKNIQLDIKNICKKHNIPLTQVFDVNDVKVCEDIEKEQYDLLISAAFPQIFSEKLLKIPKKGAINFHPSALPRCRGAHPHYWALHKGEEYGGLTAHFMTKNLDDGDIIAQLKFPISHYNYTDYYNKIEEETPKLVKKVQNYFFSFGIKKVPQNSKEMTYFKNNREIHHRIFWNLHDANQINNIYRAGGAFFYLRGERVTLMKAGQVKINRNITNRVLVENGTVVDFSENAIVVSTLKDFITIQTVQFRGKSLSWRKWADTCKIKIGLKLE